MSTSWRDLRSFMPIFVRSESQMVTKQSGVEPHYRVKGGSLTEVTGQRLYSSHKTARAAMCRVEERSLERALESMMSYRDFSAWVLSASGIGVMDVKYGLIRCRRYQKSIIRILKTRYNGRCQICCWPPQEYGWDLCEAHHIRHYALSLDNSARNIVILCPNCHTLIHKSQASYVPESKSFVCPDGTLLLITVNLHLT